MTCNSKEHNTKQTFLEDRSLMFVELKQILKFSLMLSYELIHANYNKADFI